MTKIRPLSSRDRQLLEMDTIKNQLPICFDPEANQGGSGPLIEKLTIQCAKCKHQIDESHQLGMINRLSKDEIRYEAIGVCVHCRVCTPVYYLIDRSFRLRTLKNGRWVYLTSHQKRREANPRRFGQSLTM